MARNEKRYSSQCGLVKRSFSTANEYARLYDGSGPAAHFLNERLQRVSELVSSIRGGKLLDIGCGPGMLLSCLGGGQFELFGLDLCPEMIAEAKARTAGVPVNLAVGRLQQLPFRAQSFDVILALGVLEYLPDQRAGLMEMARLAKPNAIIVVSMLNKASLYRWWERFIYRPGRAFWHWLRSRRRGPRPTLWLQTQKSLMRVMKACQLEPIDVVYYDLNVCVPPFDSRYPRRASALNRWVGARFGEWLCRLVHTAFIVKARRRSQGAPGGNN